MQIVIELPDTNITEDIIRAAKWEDGSLFDMALRGAIKNAIILPKGHGELVDYEELKNNAREYGAYAEATLSHIKPKTIIEADKAESEA